MIGLAVVRWSCCRPARAGSATALVYAVLGRRPGSRSSSRGSIRSSSGSHGLATIAYPAARGDLERATDLFRLFREQPTSELARSARAGAALGDLAERAAAAALPPVDELRDRAAVRAGERRDRDQRRLSLARVQVSDHARHHRRLRRRQARRNRGVDVARHAAEPRADAAAGGLGVGAGGGTIAGIGFTVSLLIATLAFTASQLEEAKLGVLSAATVCVGVTWLVFRVTARSQGAAAARAARHGRGARRSRGPGG